MHQSSAVNGNGNTVVQIEGNGNTIVLGTPYLKLTRFEADQTGELTDLRLDHLRLLLPTARAIPLVGRDEEMASLLQFVRDDSPRDIRARVLTGGGGSGKTRLALELCHRIKTTWNAGFVTTQALDRFSKQQDASDWGWQKPTLIVFDYAAAHAAVLTDWLTELQDRPPPPHPLRLLLLERHADVDSGWHQAVFSPGGWSHMRKRELLDPPEPVAIRSLPEQADRLAIVSAVVERVAPELLEKLVSEPALTQQLSQSPWGGDPLYLAMAALTIARSGNTSALRLGRTDLALEVAGHEQQRLRQLANSHGLDANLLEHLCACVTLAQGMPRAEAMALAQSEKAATGFQNADAPARLVDALQQAFPEDQGLAPIRPDLIGEAFLLRVWTQPERAQAIERLFEGKPQAVVESLVRLMQDFDASSEVPHIWFSSLIKAHKGDEERLELMNDAAPDISVALSRIKLDLASRLFDLCQREPKANPERNALKFLQLSLALHRNGQSQIALSVAKQAVALYGNLARERPETFMHHLATSISNVANFLTELGEPENALTHAEYAVALHQKLAERRPFTFTPHWAISLHNLAYLLSELGQSEKALAIAEQVVTLHRELENQHPDTFTSDLASSLNILGNVLSDLGKSEKALAVAMEAADLYRELARQRPDAFTPDLAMSLNNLATRLSERGKPEIGLTTAVEAARLYRELARQRPDAFTPDLARSLIVLALRNEEFSNTANAHELAKEAVKTLAPVFMSLPSVHRHLMASILKDYLSLCQAAQQEPDDELLSSLIPFLQPPPEPKD